MLGEIGLIADAPEFNIESLYTIHQVRPEFVILRGVPFHKRIWRVLSLILLGKCYLD